MDADEQDAVWVAWEDPEGAVSTLRLARAKGEGEPRTVDVGAPMGRLPSVTAPANRIVLAWLDGQRIRVMRAADADR
ncbi:MAG TPA: hypothetical protein VMM12_03105 [Longimicrobiales bacterium]|nr:hypothetical protein [Longimicrobiales bacterium]